MSRPATVTALLFPCTVAVIACGGDLVVAENGRDGGSSSGTPASSGDLDSSPHEAELGSGSSSSGGELGGADGGGGSRDSSASSGSSGGDPLSDAPFYVQAAPLGLAGFSFVVNGVGQTPLSCPADSWEYPPSAAQLRTLPEGAPPGLDTQCGAGQPPEPPCPGLSAILVNTGQYPVAYTAQPHWSGWQPPGVPFGNPDELSGVMNPGESVDITSAFVGGVIVAVLGSSRPFVDPDAGKYVADGTAVAWPAGVAGSEGATQMYVAEIEIEDSCRSPLVFWP